MPALIVFDLDGTLVDSRRDLTDAANAMLAEYGADPLDEPTVGRMVGEGAGVLVGRVLQARGLAVPQGEALARYLELYDARLLEHTRPYDGVPETVEVLRASAALAVLTNKPIAATDRLLHAFGLREAFAHVIGGDSPLGRKPDPAALLWIATTCGAALADTVMVGDSLIDLRTSRAAGTQACVARYGFGFLELPADALDGSELLIDSPRDLPRVLGLLATPAPESLRRNGDSPRS